MAGGKRGKPVGGKVWAAASGRRPQGLGGHGQEFGFLPRVRGAIEGFCLLKGFLRILIEWRMDCGWVRLGKGGHGKSGVTLPPFCWVPLACPPGLPERPSLPQTKQLCLLQVLVHVQTPG